MSAQPTERTRVLRHPERGDYERDTIDAILDEALYCHVGFVSEGQPVVLPTIHVRVRDALYLHGAIASAMLKNLSQGGPVCVTVTLLDGLVLARSVYNHSMNYRSVTVFGMAREVTDREEKLMAVEALVEHVVSGRSGDARAPSEPELKATRVVKLDLSEASAKIRSGPPKDNPEDLALPVWAGVIPMVQTALAPEQDPMQSGVDIPDYLRR